MNLVKPFTLLLAGLALSGCEGFGRTTNTTVDGGIDSKPLSELKAGIWIDPNGCDHWMIDDGLEGYLSQRLGRDGKPVCSGSEFANTIVGDIRSGSAIFDAL